VGPGLRVVGVQVSTQTGQYLLRGIHTGYTNVCEPLPVIVPRVWYLTFTHVAVAKGVIAGGEYAGFDHQTGNLVMVSDQLGSLNNAIGCRLCRRNVRADQRAFNL
jgi:hypothetical protein